MIGCVGGGSNFTGFIAPFVREKIGASAIEPDSIPAPNQGEYRYDRADYSEMTPRILMYTLGHRFVPPPVHSGGLRYHGKTPVLSALVKNNVVDTRTYGQREVFDAGRVFLKVFLLRRKATMRCWVRSTRQGTLREPGASTSSSSACRGMAIWI